jgi:cell division protease FtsH
MRRNKLLGMNAMAYGGRVAESLVFGDVSAGAQNDIKQATKIARMMVCDLGMSDSIGPIRYAADHDDGYLGRELHLSPDLSEDTRGRIDAEIREICDAQYRRADEMVASSRVTLDALAAGLMRYETLSGDEVAAVVRGDNLEEFRAAKARREAKARPPTGGKEMPDLGLAGAEGLAPSS